MSPRLITAFVFALVLSFLVGDRALAQSQGTAESHATHTGAPMEYGAPAPEVQESSTALRGDPLGLEQLQRLAVEANPTLAQARALVDAAEGRRVQAGLYPNPDIGYSTESASPNTRGGEQGFIIGQTIVTANKLGLSQNIAAREKDQAQIEAEIQVRRVLTNVAILYYEALAARKIVETRTELAKIADEAVEITRGLKNVGQADEPDLLQAQVEAKAQFIAVQQARNQEMRVWREIAALTGQPELGPRPLAGTFDDAIPELDKEDALKVIMDESPEVRLAEVVVERAKAALARARVELIPNINFIGGMRTNFSRQDNGSIVGPTAIAEIAVVIPLFDRNQGNVSAARADIIRAQHEVRRTRLGLQARFAPVFADYATAKTAAHEYRSEILPQTQRAYELYLRRYRQMAAAYPQVLIAQRTMFQSREMHIAALRSVWQSAALLRGLLLTDGLAAPALHFPVETVPAMQPLRLLPAG